MIPKFRAWVHCLNKMLPVKEIDFDDFMPSVMVEINSERHEQMFFKNTDYPDCELMQSTGLYDKNGKEIFEGDIVKNINTESKGRVIWDINNTGWHYSVKKKATSLFDNYTLFRSKHNLEVIGNVHENPELLEVEEWNGTN